MYKNVQKIMYKNSVPHPSVNYLTHPIPQRYNIHIKKTNYSK